MVDRDILRSRLEHAEEGLRRLAVIRSRGKDAFLASWENRDIATRNLQTVIQAILDIGNHLVTDAGLGAPERYVDILEKMVGAGMISASLAGRLVPVFGMRNVLVHEYVRLDVERIWAALEDPSALLDFIQGIANQLPPCP